MFKKTLTAYIMMKLVLSFDIIINDGMHKYLYIYLSFNFIVIMVASKAVFLEGNGLRLSLPLDEIEHCFSEVHP